MNCMAFPAYSSDYLISIMCDCIKSADEMAKSQSRRAEGQRQEEQLFLVDASVNYGAVKDDCGFLDDSRRFIVLF